MTFHRDAERQANAAVDSLLNSVSDALRRELDAVRAEFDARLAALQPPLGKPEHISLIERLVEDLSGAAAREAEQAALRATRDAEQAAELQLATAQTAAQAQLEQERANNDALRRTIEELQAQTQEVASTAQAEIQAIRATLTAALDEARETHANLSASSTVAQQDAAASRADLQERTAQLEATEQRLQVVEEAHARTQQTLAASVAQLACEMGDRTALVDSLEAAQQAATEARAEADACRAELCDANAHAQTLQQQLAVQGSDAAPLARLRRSLRAFTELTRAKDVLETFVEQLAREFDRVALFTVRENRLEGWRSVGFEPTTDVSNVVIPLAIKSPLTRAASEAVSLMVESGPDGPKAGLLGHDTHCVIAIPIVTKEGVVAVAYAEMARASPVESRRVGLQIAEILVECVMESFTKVHGPLSMPGVESAATAVGRGNSVCAPTILQPSYPGPARGVDRVHVPETLEVLVDGGPARLVDISTVGAQVLCMKPIRPNHLVRMLLPREDQAVLCHGRVVWAVYEMVPAGGRFRAGLSFTNVNTDALEAFLNQQLANSHRTSA